MFFFASAISIELFLTGVDVSNRGQPGRGGRGGSSGEDSDNDDDCDDDDDDDDCKVLNEWKREISAVQRSLKAMFNRQFGSTFRSYNNPTYFSRKLFR